MPASIVLIVSIENKFKLKRKYSFLGKCVENGVEISPELLADPRKKNPSPRATLKTMLLNRLTAGVITLMLGIGLLIWSVTCHTDDLFFLASIALIAVNIGLLS